MAWNVGYCSECGVLFHDGGVNWKWKDDRVRGFEGGCPVCKKDSDFVVVNDLSDQ